MDVQDLTGGEVIFVEDEKDLRNVTPICPDASEQILDTAFGRKGVEARGVGFRSWEECGHACQIRRGGEIGVSRE